MAASPVMQTATKFGRAFKVMTTRRFSFSFDRVEFSYSRLSYRRIFNWLLTEISCTLRLERTWGYPTHIQLEPSTLCNLSCPLCYATNYKLSRGHLRLTDFRRIMDELGDYLLFLHFWGWGEPFSNPEIFKMIRLAKDKGVKIITSTNGHFFSDLSRIDRLIESGLDVLIFALDGVDRTTYEKYRHQGDFDLVLNGLRRLLARRAELGAESPRVNLRMVVTRDNEDQVPAMRRMALQLGVDLLTLKTLGQFGDDKTWRQLEPRDASYHRYRYDRNGRRIKVTNQCKKMWNHPSITWDGRLIPCDYHSRREISLGRPFIDGFSGAWFGPPFRELRRRFKQSKLAGLECADCFLNYGGVDRLVSHAFDTGPAKKTHQTSR